MQSLEINILFDSRNRGEIYFNEIITHTNIIDSEDFEPNQFWKLSGGFEVTLNGYNTIFHSLDFPYLVKVTSFLINSMYWIKGKTSDWFDKDDTFPNDIIIRSTANNLIRLQKLNENELSFSYTPSIKNIISKRRNRFFENVIISKNDWFIQTNIALSEYFKSMIEIINKNDTNETSKSMLKYIEVWEKISKEK